MLNLLPKIIYLIKMKAVELFCGIGGFRIACDNLKIKTIFANDIDERSSNVYKDNFGEKEIRVGDINNYLHDIPKHDLLTAGFPCQPFSSAGKKKGIQDYRGTIFEKICKIIKKYNPNYFVLENVKRLLSMEKGNHFKTILNALSDTGYFIEWRLISALDYGLAQNRQRVFITGIKEKRNHYKLIDEQEFLKIKSDSKIILTNDELWQEIGFHNKAFKNWGLCYDGKLFEYDLDVNTNNKLQLKLKDVLQKEKEIDDMFYFSESDNLERINNSEEVNKFYQGVEILFNQEGGRRLGYTIFGDNGCASTLTSSTSRHYERYLINGKMRRLTNIEYARLQGFPDLHCKDEKIYHQYYLYGNAVPPIMVEDVVKKLINNRNYVVPEKTLFNYES